MTMANEFQKEYQNSIPKITGYRCRKCGWFGGRLETHYDIEVTHPLNRHKGKNSTDLHVTTFQRCPNCKRVHYADGKPAGYPQYLEVDVE